MEISSMTSRWQFSQPCRTPGRWARATHWARGAWPEPMPMSDTVQVGLKSQPPHLSPPFPQAWAWLLTQAQGLTLTCKGMKGGAANVAGCHPGAGSGHSASRGQRSQDMLQQIGLSCPWAVGKVRVACSSLLPKDCPPIRSPVFPLIPALPVKKTLWPFRTIFSTAACSSESFGLVECMLSFFTGKGHLGASWEEQGCLRTSCHAAGLYAL